MMKIRNVAALSATMAVVAMGLCSFAQDDLDALLKDLEKESKPAAAAPAPKSDEKKAEGKPVEAVAEKKADEKPAEAAAEKKTEEKAEEKPVEAVAEKKADEKPAEAAVEKKTEEKAEEKPAEAVAEKKADEKPAEAAAEKKTEEKAEEKPAEEVAEKKADEKPAEAAAEKKAEKPAPVATKPADPDAELLANVRATETLRREALDAQAKREIEEARTCMDNAEFSEAVRHYGLASQYLNDRSGSEALRKECTQGIAEGLYRAALQEDSLGRRERARKLMEQAVDMRHPRARRTLEKWAGEVDPSEKMTDVSEITHRQNDEDYKQQREQIRKHLRRSRQLFSVRDIEKALEECEIVLKNDPYNQEAIRLRNAIQKKRQTILEQERVASRDGMIADVDQAWRPVYAVNAARLNETSAETVKKQTGEDPERTQEQDIERRMKEMRLPTISFKPPATIIDAVEFFRGASKDYDRPDIPIEKRGFNFVLKTPQGALKAAAGEGEQQEESNDFSANAAAEGDKAAPANGLDPIPTITASDITFYEALKLVCDSVDYKFIVRGPVVMVMQKDMSTAELLSRKYDVLDAFLERMTAASSDVKEMKSQGFGGSSSNKKSDEGEENQERDWKEFFSQMGVKWPEGSSIMYIKTLGKLYVRNTRENLAEFEKVLQEMGSQPKLIEIEARFVEVEQEDLNSLGFEWILNSDYTASDAFGLGKALNLGSGVFGTETGSTTYKNTVNQMFNSSGSSVTTGSGYNNTVSAQGSSSTLYGGTMNSNSSMSDSATSSSSSSTDYTGNRTIPNRPVNQNFLNNQGGTPNVGVNAFGGTDSSYGNGNRYLSQTGNHISGENASNNDQFMRVNAFLGQADLSLILHMLAQRSDTDLLSAPKVVTKSGENAVIKVVTEYIYPQDYDVQLQSSSSSSSGGSSSGGGQSAILAVVEPQNFTMREVGVILDVTPTYSEANGGTIDLELKPQVVDEPIWHNYGMRIPFTGNTSSGTMADIGNIFTGMSTALATIGADLTDVQKNALSATIVQSATDAAENVSTASSATMTWYDAPMEQPWFHVRSIDSKVSITPGSTVVMGGLITESRLAMDDKVPYLGDLPFIGRLFRSHAEKTTKRNLLIFVTGRLITPSGRELRLNDETVNETEVKPAPKAE